MSCTETPAKRRKTKKAGASGAEAKAKAKVDAKAKVEVSQYLLQQRSGEDMKTWVMKRGKAWVVAVADGHGRQLQGKPPKDAGPNDCVGILKRNDNKEALINMALQEGPEAAVREAFRLCKDASHGAMFAIGVFTPEGGTIASLGDCQFFVWEGKKLIHVQPHHDMSTFQSDYKRLENGLCVEAGKAGKAGKRGISWTKSKMKNVEVGEDGIPFPSKEWSGYFTHCLLHKTCKLQTWAALGDGLRDCHPIVRHVKYTGPVTIFAATDGLLVNPKESFFHGDMREAREGVRNSVRSYLNLHANGNKEVLDFAQTLEVPEKYQIDGNWIWDTLRNAPGDKTTAENITKLSITRWRRQKWNPDDHSCALVRF